MLLKHRDPDCGGNNDTGVVRTLKHYTCLPYHFHRRRPDRPNRLIVSNLVFSGKKRILVIIFPFIFNPPRRNDWPLG